MKKIILAAMILFSVITTKAQKQNVYYNVDTSFVHKDNQVSYDLISTKLLFYRVDEKAYLDVVRDDKTYTYKPTSIFTDQEDNDGHRLLLLNISTGDNNKTLLGLYFENTELLNVSLGGTKGIIVFKIKN